MKLASVVDIEAARHATGDRRSNPVLLDNRIQESESLLRREASHTVFQDRAAGYPGSMLNTENSLILGTRPAHCSIRAQQATISPKVSYDPQAT